MSVCVCLEGSVWARPSQVPRMLKAPTAAFADRLATLNALRQRPGVLRAPTSGEVQDCTRHRNPRHVANWLFPEHGRGRACGQGSWSTKGPCWTVSRGTNRKPAPPNCENHPRSSFNFAPVLRPFPTGQTFRGLGMCRVRSLWPRLPSSGQVLPRGSIEGAEGFFGSWRPLSILDVSEKIITLREDHVVTLHFIWMSL